MNKCHKTNCNKPTIYRSNLCVKHDKELKKEQDDIIIEEERRLKKEQDDEYKVCLEQDTKINEDKELQKIMKESLDSYYNEKKKLIKNEGYYTVKIKFPQNITVHKFDINSKINDIFDVIDIYIYENKLNINNYNIILNFPKKIFTKENDGLFLHDISLEQNFLVHVQDIDS